MRLATLATVLATIPASAASCPSPEGAPAVASIDGERRLAFLETSLDRATTQSVKWGGFWRASFQTVAVAQFTLGHLAKREADRIDLIAGGIKASTGFLFATAIRLPAESYDRAWGPRVWEEGPLCVRVAAAEAALMKQESYERRGRSFSMHALGLGFNVAVGVIQYVMHRRLWSVALAMISGGIVGEIRIFTQPTDSTRAMDAYRAGAFGASAPSAPVAVMPLIVPHPGGGELGVAVAF